ncbi:MAG: hypothetical protein HY327_12515 [Chloroflexi bacterium]|nr:hypothetical protein [Chloroflexota bacterium]
MLNSILHRVILIVILSALVVIQGTSAPAAAQDCGRTPQGVPIPCPPSPQPTRQQPPPQQPPGQPPSGEGQPQLPQPKIGQLCAVQPTIDLFKANKFDDPQKGPGFIFEWKVRNAESAWVSMESDAINGFLIGILDSNGNYDPTESNGKAMDLNGKTVLKQDYFVGFKSATFHASCPPYETTATLNPDPEWFSKPNNNTNPNGVNPNPPPPPTPGSSQTLYSDTSGAANFALGALCFFAFTLLFIFGASNMPAEWKDFVKQFFPQFFKD